MDEFKRLINLCKLFIAICSGTVLYVLGTWLTESLRIDESFIYYLIGIGIGIIGIVVMLIVFNVLTFITDKHPSMK